MHFIVDLDADVLKHQLDAVQRALVQPDMLLGSVGESLLRINQARHRSAVDPEGNPWAPLKPAARAAKRSRRMLFASGDMLRFVYQVVDDAVLIGTVDRKAVWHHFGTESYVIRPRHKQALAFGGRLFRKVDHPGLPARRLIGLPDSDQQVIASVVRSYFSALVK